MKVSDITGNSAFTPQDGQRLYTLLFPLLEKGERVTLDFTGVTAMTSVFLNFSIGHLAKYFDVSKNIIFVVPDRFQRNLVDKVLENAQQFYSEAS